MRSILWDSLNTRYQGATADVQAKVPLLFYLHASLLLFLSVTAVLVIFLTPGASLAVYLSIVLISFVLVCIATRLNLIGRYPLALCLTILIMFVAPWASILYESIAGSGDLMPMIFVIIPIQIAALFLATKAMLMISGIQTVAVIVNVIISGTKSDDNWVSVVCYVFIASLLGSVTSYLIRNQYNTLLASKEALAQNQEKLHNLSIRDALSGVYNRRYMDEMLDLLVQRPKDPFAVLMVDVDRFKSVNDTCGHRVGDAVIQSIAAILTSVTRKNDVVCRYGGDEFLLILMGCSYEAALAKAHEIRRLASGLGCACDDPEAIPITASIGIALFPEHGTDKDSLLHAADSALYQAKEEGRNRVKSS